MHIFIKVKIVIIAVFFLAHSQASFANKVYKVKPSDTMHKVVKSNYKNSQLSKHQIYVAILAENPNAFAFGNINYLKVGQSLNLPSAANLVVMEKQDAVQLISQHNFNAKQGNKVKMPSPFEGYMPKKHATENLNLDKLAEAQLVASEQLQKLDSEREALRIRIEQLNADKEAMDAELLQLESLIKNDNTN